MGINDWKILWVFEDFNEQECTFCGECFYQSPVMSLPKEKAKDEMKRLVQGQETEQVLETAQVVLLVI